MVTIRLMRVGKKSRPYYRIVAQEARRKADGSYLELLGHYDPRADASGLAVKLDRVKIWQAKGATISPSVRTLVKRAKASAS